MRYKKFQVLKIEDSYKYNNDRSRMALDNTPQMLQTGCIYGDTVLVELESVTSSFFRFEVCEVVVIERRAAIARLANLKTRTIGSI